MVELGAVDSVEGLVDLMVVPLDGGDSALGNQLQSADLLVGGLSRGAAAVAGRRGGCGDHIAGLLRSDESSRGHCEVVLVGLRSCVWVGDLEDDLEKIDLIDGGLDCSYGSDDVVLDDEKMLQRRGKEFYLSFSAMSLRA